MIFAWLNRIPPIFLKSDTEFVGWINSSISELNIRLTRPIHRVPCEMQPAFNDIWRQVTQGISPPWGQAGPSINRTQSRPAKKPSAFWRRFTEHFSSAAHSSSAKSSALMALAPGAIKANSRRSFDICRAKRTTFHKKEASHSRGLRHNGFRGSWMTCLLQAEGKIEATASQKCY